MNFNNLIGKVKYCLDKYPETRNSDIKLFNSIIVEFPIYNKYLHKNEDGTFKKPLAINLLDLYEIPKQEDIARIRRKFNEKGFYLATDPNVIDGRKKRETQWRNRMSPSNPSKY